MTDEPLTDLGVKASKQPVERVPCPFTYANGKKCTGYITHVEAYKCDVSWSQDDDGKWQPSEIWPRSHYHLFCSEKGNHAGYQRGDDWRLKFYLNQLPDGIKI
jgi:hypothetical protein